MKRAFTTSIIMALLAGTLPAGAARAQAVAADVVQPSGPPPQQPPPAPAWTATPPQPQPLEPPVATTTQPQALPDGQWVYTAQYGWLWMPYGSQYVQVQPDASLAYMFAFYPAFGWRWVVAPWVLGLGVAPFWGTPGPRHFAWYGHPYVHAVPYRGRGWARPMAVARPVHAAGHHHR